MIRSGGRRAGGVGRSEGGRALGWPKFDRTFLAFPQTCPVAGRRASRRRAPATSSSECWGRRARTCASRVRSGFRRAPAPSPRAGPGGLARTEPYSCEVFLCLICVAGSRERRGGGRIYTGGFRSRARCGRGGLQTAPWTPRLGGIRALLRWDGHTPPLGSPAARNLARAGVGESRNRSSDPGPAAAAWEGGRETDGVSSGGLLSSRTRSLGWLVESRDRTPHCSKAGACGGERGWGGEQSANYVPRRQCISSASALPGLLLQPLVVKQLFRTGSGAPVGRSPRPRCAGMKSRPREFRRPSEANTSIVFTFSLWVWTWVAAFFCSLLPARRRAARDQKLLSILCPSAWHRAGTR